MTRVATSDTQDSLLNIAKYGTASHIENTVRKWKKVLKQYDPNHDEEAIKARSLKFFYDDADMLGLRAKFPTEQGVFIKKGIIEISRIEHEKRLSDRKVSAETALNADENFLKLSEAKKKATLEAVHSEIFHKLVDEFSSEQRYADALTIAIENYFATVKNGNYIKTIAGHENAKSFSMLILIP